MSDDVRIRLARERGDFDACVRLQEAVWGVSDICGALQLQATTYAGGTLHVAETAAGEVVGFAYAFAALRGGVAHLHSDMLAVLPEHQKRGVGVRLKWAQREEAIARGLSLVTWTFDPLQARNAHLNLRRLGGRATEFLEDFYGITGSALHHGLPTDRLWVRWELHSPRVLERLAAGEPAPSVPDPGLARVNAVRWESGWPVSSEPETGLGDAAVALEIPPDFDILCQAAPRLAEDWHGKVRKALRAYFGRGYLAADFAPTEDHGRRRPLYVLAKE